MSSALHHDHSASMSHHGSHIASTHHHSTRHHESTPLSHAITSHHRTHHASTHHEVSSTSGTDPATSLLNQLLQALNSLSVAPTQPTSSSLVPHSPHTVASPVPSPSDASSTHTSSPTVHLIRQHITLAQRLPSAHYTSFLSQLHAMLQSLINSPNVTSRLKALRAIDILIDIKYDDPRKITKFCMFLRSFLTFQYGDSASVRECARVLGKLARVSARSTSKTLTAEWVDFESKRAMEWLEGDTRSKSDGRRYAAVLVLKELAENAPTLFYTHVGNFIIHMWHGIKDPNEHVRKGCVHALRAVLALIAERQSTVRVEWYYDIWEKTKNGLIKGKVEQVHGCLLVLGELLRNTGAFMQDRFENVCTLVLKFHDHRDKQLVRRTVLKLLPMLCSFYKEDFIKEYLDKSITIITKEIKSQTTRGTAYIALGKLVKACPKEALEPRLPQVIAVIQDGVLPHKKKPKSHQVIPEALTCMAYLGEAVGDDISDQILKLLDPIFAFGLSKALTDALSSLVETNASLRQPIQQHLLDTISIILAKIPYHSVNYAHNQSVNIESEDTIVHALETLGTFHFKSHDLIDFVRDTVISYMENDSVRLKKAAAQTCCKLLAAQDVNDATEYAHFQIGDTIIRLLTVAITDAEYTVRQAVLSSFTPQFDNYLAISENVKMLFIALNDEHYEIRELAVRIIGRLSTKNPAYVYPSLRKTLLQLLTELQYSEDVRSKEESARMLGCLVSAAPKLVKPYVPQILRVLMSKMTDSSSSVSACVLETTGKLAIVGGSDMARFINEVLPLVIETLSDQSSSTKRAIAVRTLGQIVESTGYVVKPYQEYPQLLSTLLGILKSEEEWEARREVMKVLGIIGAIDPHKYKLLHEKVNYNLVLNGHVNDIPDGLSPSSEEYYPTVAFTALMKILSDSSLSAYHTAVIQAVLYIFTSLGMKCVPFLKQIMGPFFELIRTCEPKFRKPLFQKLSLLVSIVRHHIRNYLDDIFKLIVEFWDSDFKIQIISLEESICSALNEEFKPYLSDVIPHLLDVFQTDRSLDRQVTIKGLHALTVFGKYLQDYLYLVIPAVVRLFEDSEAPVAVKCHAIRTVGNLSRGLNLIEFSSRIIHPLMRVLKSGNQELVQASMDTLSMLAFQFGHDFIIYIPMINKIMLQHRIQHSQYEDLEHKIKKNLPLPSTIHWDDADEDDDDQVESVSSDLTRMHVDEDNLREGWKASQRSTKEDWIEWIRGFSVVLLKESPSHALRSCSALAQTYHPLARELFNAGFVSCWSQLEEKAQQEVVRSLEIAFSSPELPAEVLQTLLNLAEFMEHDEKPLPIAISALGLLAERCQCYAKALHYKEIEFLSSPEGLIEELMFINNQLGQHEAAVGILKFSQKHFDIEMKEAWYEKLQWWEKALKVYERKWEGGEHSSREIIEGRMRCLKELGRWEDLYDVCKDVWHKSGDSLQASIAPMAAAAAWNLQDWDLMRICTDRLPGSDVRNFFYRTILAIHDNNFDVASELIEKTRIHLSTELSALVGESYIRAYDNIILIQQLSEMEEIIQYKQMKLPEEREKMKKMWFDRLNECTSNVEHWQQILLVRRLVLSPKEDRDLSIKFSSLCRKSNKLQLSEKTLRSMLPRELDPTQHPQLLLSPEYNVHPAVAYNYFKHMWATNQKTDAFQLLNQFAQTYNGDPSLIAKCYLRLGLWQKKLHKQYPNSDEQIPQILHYLKAATEYDPKWYKAWHYWALMNSEVVSMLEKGRDAGDHSMVPASTQQHGNAQNARAQGGHLPTNVTAFILNAIHAFFRSISLSPDHNKKLQDILRLLTLWFNHGNMPSLEVELTNGFNTVSIDTWLGVIPQIIARVNSQVKNVRNLIHNLLEKIGHSHPQALVYPLTVCSKSHVQSRKLSAQKLLNQIRIHSAELVDQAMMVSNELISGAILWNELWHEGLEDASRLYFGDRNIEGMLSILEPLHQATKNPQTLSEIAFQQQFGSELLQARECCKKYRRTKDENFLNQAWDCYYLVFRRINRQLQVNTKLELQYVSPKLLKARNLKLAVPGTYQPQQQQTSAEDDSSGAVDSRHLVTISSFHPVWKVISSKQRPRQIVIKGSDGHDYEFLLKGHEDLRQDERVMQLFGLVNTLLANDLSTCTRDLSIKQYAVIPLSSNAGLIGWVPNCDTLHQLIKEYRESRAVVLNLEHRLMMQMTPHYDNLALMQKIEVFEHALENTTGQDLYKILWLKSKSSEVWLDRRTNYTRSLAVMSMVGYILGLGDRHPSNIMLEKHSGKIVHIDFGDCFEVAQNREKFPEKVPFRLTRMLVNAMEVCGIEGSFRATCEDVMRVLRENKDSLMAMLEAFVHDPLINWRLLDPNMEHAGGRGATSGGRMSSSGGQVAGGRVGAGSVAGHRMSGNVNPHHHHHHHAAAGMSLSRMEGNVPNRSVRERQLKRTYADAAEAAEQSDTVIPEQLNMKALSVIRRISDKLSGNDFRNEEKSSVPEQVNRLIQQATSHSNLSQLYVGWSGVW